MQDNGMGPKGLLNGIILYGFDLIYMAASKR